MVDDPSVTIYHEIDDAHFIGTRSAVIGKGNFVEILLFSQGLCLYANFLNDTSSESHME